MNDTTANHGSMFSCEKEYFRLEGVLYATEEGLYKELPEDLAVAYIEINVVYLIVMATASGEMRAMKFANERAMDKDKKKGGPVTFTMGENTYTLYTDDGDGTLALELDWVTNPHLSSEERSRYDELWLNLISNSPNWYG